MSIESMELRGPPGVGSQVEGRALVSRDGFSARYDLDPDTGAISRRSHDLYGSSIVGAILVLPVAKGGVATSWRLFDLVARGTAPTALIFRETNPVMVQGAVLAGIPLMHQLSPDAVDSIRSGDWIRMNPELGRVIVDRKTD